MNKLKTIIRILIIFILFMSCDAADKYLGINENFLEEEEEKAKDSGGEGGGSGFSPRSIGNLALWLDASDISTITLNGTDIVQWDDKSGNGRNFIYQTLATAPNLNALALNNKNTILFTQANPNNNKLKIYSGTIECLISTIFITYRAVGVNEYFYFLGNTSSPTLYRILSPANNIFNVAYNGATTENITVNLINENNSAHILMTKLRDNNNKYVVSLDGDIEINSPSDFTGKTTYPFDVLGADTNISVTLNSLFNGDIAEVIIYQSLLTTIEKQKIEGFLAWKWGLVAKLPADHPYKTVAP